MRKPQRNITRAQVSETKSVSAPVGGWNTRDPIANMKEGDAVILDNMFCRASDVIVRKGYTKDVTGITGQVRTLARYANVSGAEKLFAFAGSVGYDASTAGTAITSVSGFLSDAWQHTLFSNEGGDFGVFVNGTDLPIVYNGTGWSTIQPATFNTTPTSITSTGTTATVTTSGAHNLKTGMSVTVAGYTPSGYNGTFRITVTGTNTFTYTLPAAQAATTTTGTVTPVANFAITGVNPARLINVAQWKRRLWFVEENTNNAWYLPVNSLGGTAVPLNVGSLFSEGGYLVAVADWTLDAGEGTDDYLVFISSKGQVAVYSGTDPASADTFSLTGVFTVAPPIGYRCFNKFGGDLTLISKSGLLPLSKSLITARLNNATALTDKILQTMSGYTQSYSSNFGWQVVEYPEQNMILLNVPISGSQSYQLVMNTINSSWSRFTAWDTSCMEIFRDALYFGGNGFVAHAWNGFSDAGSTINFEALQSFSYLQNRTQLKHVKMLRPIIASDGNPGILLGVNTDFETTAPVGTPTFTPSTAGIWGVSRWGSFTWGGSLQIKKDWQTAFGIGYCVSAHMKGALANCQMQWSAVDFVYERGGVI